MDVDEHAFAVPPPPPPSLASAPLKRSRLAL